MPPKRRTSKKRPTSKRAVRAKPSARTTAKKKRKQPETLRVRSMTPSLTVSDLPTSIAFYTKGLGFIVADRWEQDGKLAGAMLKAGNCVLMLAQDDFAKGRERVKGVGHRIWLNTIQAIDVLASRAKARGVTLEQEPADLPWGPRAFAVADPDGFKITIATEPK